MEDCLNGGNCLAQTSEKNQFSSAEKIGDVGTKDGQGLAQTGSPCDLNAPPEFLENYVYGIADNGGGYTVDPLIC